MTASLPELATELTRAVDGVDWDADRVQRAVDAILDAMHHAPRNELSAALQTLVARLERARIDDADGVAHVAITGGSLVEAGAPPRPLGDVLLARMPEVLEAARRFGDTCLAAMPPRDETGDADEDPDEEEESESIGFVDDRQISMALFRAKLGADRGGGAAFANLYTWTLPCVAAWTRDRESLVRACGDQRLVAGASAMRHSSARWIDVLLGVQLESEWLVIVPTERRAFVMTLDGIADNFQLNALVSDALIESGVPGRRNPRDVLAAVRGDTPANRVRVNGSFNFYSRGALRYDLRKPNEVPHEYWVWNEGFPRDVPAVDGMRILVVGPPAYERSWSGARPFSALRASVHVDVELPPADVAHWLARPA